MRNFRSEAVVIRRINLGETDRILTLFTKDRGKVSAIAKGSRKINSSMSGATELFSYSTFQMAMGANLDVVTQVELKNAFLGLRSSLDRIARALYVVEFCTEFLEDRQPNTELFFLLLSCLYVLEKAAPLDWIVSAFEVQALSLLGYGAQMDVCVSCGLAASGNDLRFSPALGGLLCSGCGHRHRDSLSISAAAVSALSSMNNTELAYLARQQPDQALSAEVRRLVQAHVRKRAEKELKSAKFIEQLKAEESAAGQAGP